MSNQSKKSPLPENSTEEEEEGQQEEEEEEEGQQEEEEEDKKLQEPSQEATTGGGGDERKVATLPPSAQKTSVARNGPVLKRCAANATNSCPLKKVTRAVTSPEVEEQQRQQHIHSLSILLYNLQKPPGGGRNKRKVTALLPSAKKNSTARNGPARKPYVANLIRAEPCKQVRTRAISSRRVYNLNAKSLQASKKFDSPRQPLGTSAERPLENSAKDGVSQGKEKKIKDKVHGEDDEEGEGSGEENPRDDSDSI
ncbi:hypothetical protein FH972_020451 [Carpinus fangiana]|uniref:Uncharacterized protein n=1 Tax=Carpinus fangiana TaxID=176857 RepID=A0A5N6RTS1_9ROSI|nr:hypothetical protein FH972_020451 [Carpinus fangiana]